MTDKLTLFHQALRDVVFFAQTMSGLKLREYQQLVATTITQSVIWHKGLSIVVIFPRQSGKNELQAQIETYLLELFSRTDAEIVKVSPTYKPQTMNAMRRLQRVLSRNLITTDWSKESGYIYKLGRARIFFLSGGPTTNVVGATASLLLECDEAQDVTQAKWDKDFAPMAASTNATRVFWGTMWTSRTLLARELQAAREAEKQDGQRRVFVMDADKVAAEVPAYGKFVEEQVAKLGRNHPFVRTQYYSEEIDAEGGMFPPRRQALMQGTHPKRNEPDPDKIYAMLVDVAGQDESAQDPYQLAFANLVNAERDATAATIVEIQLETLQDELIQAPTYHVVNRYSWTGIKHSTLYGELRGLADHWDARTIVVDATGVGAGLASFLDKAFPNRVIPFVFTAKSKSDLGWAFLSVIETGRYKEYHPQSTGTNVPGIIPTELGFPCQVKDHQDGCDMDEIQKLFWKQVEYCQSAVLEGPGKMLRWGVPDGTRDEASGALVHDDLLISASLCAVLDDQHWGVGASEVIAGKDIFEGMKEIY